MKIRNPPPWSTLLSLFLFVGGTVLFNRNLSEDLPVKSAYLNPPPEKIEYFTFGFKESIADSLWLRWIQGGDQCQTYKDVAVANRVQTTGAFEFDDPRRRVCDVSWSYKMLDAVSRTDPRFRMPYLAGTMVLAVLVEDYDGASRLFDRAVEIYPNDWQILYRAGYHFLFDMKDLPKAAGLLHQAASHGAPGWVNYLSARVYTRAGQAALGVATLVAYLKTVEDPDRRREVEGRIERLKRLSQNVPADSSGGP